MYIYFKFKTHQLYRILLRFKVFSNSMKPPSDTLCPCILQMTPPHSTHSFHTARIRERERWLDLGREAEEPQWVAALPMGSLPSSWGATQWAAQSRGNLEAGVGDPLADWCWLEVGLARCHAERLLWTTSVFNSNWGWVSADSKTSPANRKEVQICCLLTRFWFFFFFILEYFFTLAVCSSM